MKHIRYAVFIMPSQEKREWSKGKSLPRKGAPTLPAGLTVRQWSGVSLLLLLNLLWFMPSACAIELDPAAAQSVPAAHPSDPSLIDLKDARQALTVVSTQWRFHTGNDPNWAKPNYDDSGWKLLKVSEDWDEQGYHEEQDQAWFRFTILIPARTPGLVIQMPRISKNYRLYANGQEVGGVGDFPPGPAHSTVGAPRIFTLPVIPTQQPQRMTIALRLWQSPQFKWAQRDGFGEVQIGTPDVMLPEFERFKAFDILNRRGMDYTASVFEAPILASAIFLFILTRKRLYLWFAADMVMSIAGVALLTLASHLGWRSDVNLIVQILCDIGVQISIGMFIIGLLELRNPRWIVLSICLACLAELSTLLVVWRMPLPWADGIYLFLICSCEAIQIWQVFKAWRKGTAQAGIYFVPIALNFLITNLGNLGYLCLDAGVPSGRYLILHNVVLFDSPFPATLDDLLSTLITLGYFAVLVYLFSRISSEEQRLSAALRAAHEIQNSLVPARQAKHGGLQTDIAYLAAEEVGGDFCQILPRANGSVVVVVGDVAGKGLKAAMVGSIAVGALRSMTDDHGTPSTLLRRLNEIMVRNDERVFITCLCMEIAPDGTMTIANAGHLSPYLNGTEMECDSGLPLGLISGFPYGERSSMLPAQARLTLISDGVVEARSKTGELFGFERTLGISRQEASQIASVAQKFGQEDDITVVTLDWTASLTTAV